VERLRSYQPGKASKLLDRNAKLITVLSPVEGQTVLLEKIPKDVQAAFIAIEDKRFYDHDGIDWKRVIGATLSNIKSGGFREGFSTITMQLARNVFPDRLPASERSISRKSLEMRVAGEIEDRFSKDEILELYLSHIYFGNGARGISAASNHYFAKKVEDLTLKEGALLAAMLKGPAIYDPRRHPERARQRRDLVLDLMKEQKRAQDSVITSAREAPLGVIRRRETTTTSLPLVAPYFVEEVRRQLEDELGEQLYDETLTVHTTLDLQLQQIAEQEFSRWLGEIESDSVNAKTMQLQGAIIALQAHTGDVLAWVGGRDYRSSRFDRVKNAHRQAGSAFKPFVYAAALEEGHMLSEFLRDEPLRLELAAGRYWEPKNFDNETEGPVTVRDALVRSKNIPTVRLGQETGLGRIKDVAEQSGIESEMEETPALSLGTPAVSPLELATAYTPFSTLGRKAVPRIILYIEDSNGEKIREREEPETKEVLNAGVAYLVTNVLQEAIDRGTGLIVRKLGFRYPAAGKTGTTNDATDTWFVGYTTEVVMAVWLGFDQPRTISSSATGGRLAAPVWARIMQRSSFVKSTARNWDVPENVMEAWVDPMSGKILEEGCKSLAGDAYHEFFLRNHIPDSICPDRGPLIAAERETRPSDEEDARWFDVYPEEFGRSIPAPSVEYEEAEPPKKSSKARNEVWKKVEERRREFRKKENEQIREYRKKEDERIREVTKKAEEWKREREKKGRERAKEREKKERERKKERRNEKKDKKD